jgi:hypothetical protein
MKDSVQLQVPDTLYSGDDTGRMNLRAGLGDVEEERICGLCKGTEPCTSNVHTIAILTDSLI